MQIARHSRKPLLAAALFLLLLNAAPAHAASKEIIELQTQVQQLLDMMQRLQSTLDARFGVLQHLAEQTADEANRMTTTVNALQQKLNQQGDASGSKIDTVSGQVQSLNDSVDELKSRIAKLNKNVEEMQAQLQSAQQAQQPAPGAAPMGAPTGAAANQAPPLKESFESAVRDYNAGKAELAKSEFQDVIHYYPLDDLSGQAQFYLGEIAYKQQDYQTAISAYNAVLEGFGGSVKAPAAQLHKGYALLAESKKDAGTHELRLLIQRHPQSPEAQLARTKLNALGVRITAR